MYGEFSGLCFQGRITVEEEECSFTVFQLNSGVSETVTCEAIAPGLAWSLRFSVRRPVQRQRPAGPPEPLSKADYNLPTPRGSSTLGELQGGFSSIQGEGGAAA